MKMKIKISLTFRMTSAFREKRERQRGKLHLPFFADEREFGEELSSVSHAGRKESKTDTVISDDLHQQAVRWETRKEGREGRENILLPVILWTEEGFSLHGAEKDGSLDIEREVDGSSERGRTEPAEEEGGNGEEGEKEAG